jgi:hypothetical protein
VDTDLVVKSKTLKRGVIDMYDVAKEHGTLNRLAIIVYTSILGSIEKIYLSATRNNDYGINTMYENKHKYRKSNLILISLCSVFFIGCTSESVGSGVESGDIAEIVGKYKGDEIPNALLTNDGMNKVKNNTYLTHLEHTRLANINKGLSQQSRVIPDDLFLGFNVVSSTRQSSQTGQVFHYYNILGVELDDTGSRIALINKIQPYGGWCYVNADDHLVCDIPMIMTEK